MRYLKEVRSQIGSYLLKSGLFHLNRKEWKQAVDFFRKALKGAEADAGKPGAETPPAATIAHDRQSALFYLTEAYLGWAEELADEGKKTDAIEKYRAALEISPGYADVHTRLGMLLRETGDRRGAAEAYARALQLNPDYVEAHLQTGFTLLEEGRMAEAEAEFDRALVLHLRRMERPFREGKELLRRGLKERASELIRKAFDRRPSQAESHLKAGLRALQREKFSDAAEEFRLALSLDTSYPDVHNFLGVACAEMGKDGEAEEQFRLALERNERFIAARLNLAYLLLRQDRIEEAATHLDKVIAQDAGNRAAETRLQEIRRLPPMRAPRPG